jgi:hypothetical protein
MKKKVHQISANADSKLAKYLATTAAITAGSSIASQANAAIVANTTPIPFGINEEVDIDFNNDGIVDFQIDHDRVNLNGNDLDYLQLDKNDANGASSTTLVQSELEPVDGFGVFPAPSFLTSYANDYGSTTAGLSTDLDVDSDVDGNDFLIFQRDGGGGGANLNYDMEYMSYFDECNQFGSGGCHPSALTAGEPIGPDQDDGIDSQFMFVESLDAFGNGTVLRANRLIDEDNGQIDTSFGLTPEPPLSSPAFTFRNGNVAYLGVRMDLNDAGFTGNDFAGANGAGDFDDPANYWYGWIGIEITNEADATGVVTGWAYNDQLGTSINAGDTGVPISANNAVPEPTSMLMAAVGGFAMAGGLVGRRIFRRNNNA